MKSSITVICGHYGCGKTNLVLNLAAEAAQRGRRSVVVDMDVVNPYFRSSDYSALLKKLGVELIAPVFANTTLDTPVLPPEIFSIFNMAHCVMTNFMHYSLIDSSITFACIVIKNHPLLALRTTY